MATLAAMLKQKGFDVRGSDENVYPPMSDFLADQGITILQGYRAGAHQRRLDLVVVGNAISRGNPELEEVLDRKIRYCSLPEAIREHFLWASRSVVIAGTHGKTTTTSLTGWLLTDGGADPSVLVGGIVENFDGSYRIGGGREFVIEGDEYDSAFFDKTAKFLKYLPDIAVVATSSSITPTSTRISRRSGSRSALREPRSATGLLLLGADNADALALARARALPGRDVRPVRRRRLAGATTCGERYLHEVQPAAGGTPSGIFELPLLGGFNVRNALAAIAVGAAVGLNLDTMAEGCGSSVGSAAACSCAGRPPASPCTTTSPIIPTAIAETLDGVRSAFPDRRVWAIFEPRSATSCRRVFQEDFVQALGRADRVVLPAVFRSTLPEEERLSPEAMVEDLRRAGHKAHYIPQVDDIVTAVAKDAGAGDLVVVMSNGGFDGIHQKLLHALEARETGRV
jgi:UDP-N-acetylmuramate: L-alanyl-gamma-D-glutamyl-meso-diaminopimelate ligase